MDQSTEKSLENSDYFRNFVDRCWTASQHYKEDLNKLMLWLGSIFVGLIVTTGLFGATKPNGLTFSFKMIHVILFHIIFAISWFFYLHKKLRAEIYLRIGLEAENYFIRKFGMDELKRIPPFYDINIYYSPHGNYRKVTLSRVAIILIFGLYLTMVTYPILSGSLTDKGLSINYEPLICCAIFGIILIVGHILYKSEEKHVMKHIEKKWKEPNKN